MKKLTSRQEEFLLFFSTLQGNKKCISDASNQFQVSKPTVFNVAETLEEYGLIIKGGSGEITFTEKGLDYIAPKLEQVVVLQKWFASDLGLPPITAEFEARKTVVTLQAETVAAMVNSVQSVQEKLSQIEPQKSKTNFSSLPDGEYEVPFSVYKTNRKDISMGDKGFLKPAIFRKENGVVNVVLYSHKLLYVSQKRNRLQGKLDRLWYVSDNKWFEAEISDSSCYNILEDALAFDEKRKKCELKIRARATVGNLKMPESEAIILFDLGGLEIKKQSREKKRR
ncbi:MAG: hypothetical protein R3Y53_10845 [Bacillota bacterium]